MIIQGRVSINMSKTKAVKFFNVYVTQKSRLANKLY